MHVKDIKAKVRRVAGVAVKAGGFMRRHKRLTIAVVVAALLFAPLLLTGDGELFVLNAVGLGFGALLLRRFTRPGGRKADGTGATGTTATGTEGATGNDDAADGKSNTTRRRTR